MVAAAAAAATAICSRVHPGVQQRFLAGPTPCRPLCPVVSLRLSPWRPSRCWPWHVASSRDRVGTCVRVCVCLLALDGTQPAQLIAGKRVSAFLVKRAVLGVVPTAGLSHPDLARQRPVACCLQQHMILKKRSRCIPLDCDGSPGTANECACACMTWTLGSAASTLCQTITIVVMLFVVRSLKYAYTRKAKSSCTCAIHVLHRTHASAVCWVHLIRHPLRSRSRRLHTQTHTHTVILHHTRSDSVCP